MFVLVQTGYEEITEDIPKYGQGHYYCWMFHGGTRCCCNDEFVMRLQSCRCTGRRFQNLHARGSMLQVFCDNSLRGWEQLLPSIAGLFHRGRRVWRVCAVTSGRGGCLGLTARCMVGPIWAFVSVVPECWGSWLTDSCISTLLGHRWQIT